MVLQAQICSAVESVNFRWSLEVPSILLMMMIFLLGLGAGIFTTVEFPEWYEKYKEIKDVSLDEPDWYDES